MLNVIREQENSAKRIYVYRYIWKLKGDDKQLQCKILSESIQGHDSFREWLLSLDNLESALCEYLSEYDPTFFGLVDIIKLKEENKNSEVNCNETV